MCNHHHTQLILILLLPQQLLEMPPAKLLLSYIDIVSFKNCNFSHLIIMNKEILFYKKIFLIF